MIVTSTCFFKLNFEGLCAHEYVFFVRISHQVVGSSVSELSHSPPTAGMTGGKYRSFLVHIKAVSDRGMEESRPVVRMPSAKPQGSKGHSLSTLLQRAQASKVPNPDT